MTPARALLRLEPVAITALVWMGLAGLSVSDGGIGLSWDALNHHIYLGWIAGSHRLDQDFLAAGYQSFQFPYLYWPAYQLAIHGAGPYQAAIVLSALHALAAPAVWLIARSLLPGQGIEAVSLRALAVLLAFMSPVVLSLTDNTANDLMAATPLIWAVALASRALEPSVAPAASARLVMGSGLLAGVATAFKLSNGPLVLLLPLLWAAGSHSLLARVRRVMVAGAATLAGFLVTYGYWGWLLWERYGNPLHPFHDEWFAQLRRAMGWGA